MADTVWKDFEGKVVASWPISCEEKAHTSFVLYLKVLNFFYDSRFEYMNILSCDYNGNKRIPAVHFN